MWPLYLWRCGALNGNLELTNFPHFSRDSRDGRTEGGSTETRKGTL